MWDMSRSQEALQSAERREATLQGRHEFFGRLMQGGARYARHKDTRTSSIEIIERIVNRNRRVTLAVQEELERNSATTLVDTTVGRYLEGDLRNMRKRYETKIAQLKAYNDDSGEIDDGLLSIVQSEKELVLNIESDINFLHLTFEKLRKERGTRMMEEGRSAVSGPSESTSVDHEAVDISTENMTQTDEHHLSRSCASTELEAYDAGLQYSPNRANATTREKQSKPKRASTWEDILRATLVPSHDHGRDMFHKARRSRSEDRAPGVNYPKKASQREDRARSKAEEERYSAQAIIHQGPKSVEPDRTDQMALVEGKHQQSFDSEIWRGPQHMVHDEIRSSSPEAFMALSGLQNAISWDTSGLKRSYPVNSGTSNPRLLHY